MPPANWIIPALRLGRMVLSTTGGVRVLVGRCLPAGGYAHTRATVWRRVPASVRPLPMRAQHKGWGGNVTAAAAAATERDPRTTVLSVDGVGAYDHISRHSIAAIAVRPELSEILPYVRAVLWIPQHLLVLRRPRHSARSTPGRRWGTGGPPSASLVRIETAWSRSSLMPEGGPFKAQAVKQSNATTNCAAHCFVTK